jgi:two-component system response regulator MprA
VKKNRVLIVEDDRDIRQELAELLEEHGYCALLAEHGQHALELLQAGNRPDAIILDLMMPVMDGWAFLQACRNDALCEGVPVLVTSAFRSLAEAAPTLAVQACLAKPFDLDVLLGAVERLLRKHPASTQNTVIYR